MPLRFLTAGESHGPALNVIVEGLPAGLPVRREVIDRDLRRRMGGYGRGGRMDIETDRVEFLGGVRFGVTLGSPVSMEIRNLDFENWSEAMSPEGEYPGSEIARSVTRPRPGHADLAGALKYGTHDARNILERASARETAARTAAGALGRLLLNEAGIRITSHTVAVGEAVAPDVENDEIESLFSIPDDAHMRCLDDETVKAMIAEVDRVRGSGDSIGGLFEVVAIGIPPGLGSHVHWDRRLDGLLAGALVSIQAVKAVSIGEGVEGGVRRGSRHHDPIEYDSSEGRFTRSSNRAGGIEGGMTNGEAIRVRCYLKPLSTLQKPLPSIDLAEKKAFKATVERTDTIPIVAAGVVGEAMTCFVLAREFLRKFGGDSVEEMLRNYRSYMEALKEF